MNLIWIMPAEGEEDEFQNPYVFGIGVFFDLYGIPSQGY
jgi:hypothetical protein